MGDEATQEPFVKRLMADHRRPAIRTNLFPIDFQFPILMLYCVSAKKILTVKDAISSAIIIPTRLAEEMPLVSLQHRREESVLNFYSINARSIQPICGFKRKIAPTQFEHKRCVFV